MHAQSIQTVFKYIHIPARSVFVRETIKRRKIEGLLAVYIHTYITQHTPYQGFSVTGYIRAGTGVKQTEVDCELTNGALSSRY
jgi:hypothetical protein